MITTLLFVLVGLSAVLFLGRAVHGRTEPISSVAEATARMKQIDLPAFTNLIDPAQREYLRSRLSRHDFAYLERMRNRVCLEYVKRIADNATVLLSWGRSALLSPELAAYKDEAREIVDAAMTVRLTALYAIAQLYLGVVMPSLELQVGSLLTKYQYAASRMTTIGVLTHSSEAGAYSRTA